MTLIRQAEGRMAPWELPPSQEFAATASYAWWLAANREPDDARQYAANHVPVFILAEADPRQKGASGCRQCRLLGLWARQWPGYHEDAPHGMIWLFEAGIREQASRANKSLADMTYEVLIHELDHALERDHVLEAMERERARGFWPALAIPCCG